MSTFLLSHIDQRLDSILKGGVYFGMKYDELIAEYPKGITGYYWSNKSYNYAGDRTNVNLFYKKDYSACVRGIPESPGWYTIPCKSSEIEIKNFILACKPEADQAGREFQFDVNEYKYTIGGCSIRFR